MNTSVKELLTTTPETLASRQHKALLAETTDTFGRLVSCLARGDYKAATDMLANSPAGDGHGCDNSCIDFSHLLEPACQGCSADIGDVIARLEALSKHIPKAGK